MIYYILLTFLAIRSALLLRKGRLVNTLGVNLSDPSYDSGVESAPFMVTLPDPHSAFSGFEDGDGNDITDRIMDSGSNSDGDWYKFANGVMIQIMQEDLDYGGFTNYDVTLPLNFTDTEYVATINRNEGGTTQNTDALIGVYPNFSGMVRLQLPTEYASSGIFANTITCIGRWK